MEYEKVQPMDGRDWQTFRHFSKCREESSQARRNPHVLMTIPAEFQARCSAGMSLSIKRLFHEGCGIRRRYLPDLGSNPDLKAFDKGGGKLIVAICTNDTLASPGALLDYYQSVIKKMGRKKVDAIARLFVLPQANHGLGGTNYSVDGNGKSIPTAPFRIHLTDSDYWLIGLKKI